MGCINVRYEKQFTTSSVVWIDSVVFNKNIFDLQWQLIIKVKINKVLNTEFDNIL